MTTPPGELGVKQFGTVGYWRGFVFFAGRPGREGVWDFSMVGGPTAEKVPAERICGEVVKQPDLGMVLWAGVRRDGFSCGDIGVYATFEEAQRAVEADYIARQLAKADEDDDGPLWIAKGTDLDRLGVKVGAQRMLGETDEELCRRLGVRVR